MQVEAYHDSGNNACLPAQRGDTKHHCSSWRRWLRRRLKDSVGAKETTKAHSTSPVIVPIRGPILQERLVQGLMNKSVTKEDRENSHSPLFLTYASFAAHGPSNSMSNSDFVDPSFPMTMAPFTRTFV